MQRLRADKNFKDDRTPTHSVCSFNPKKETVSIHELYSGHRDTAGITSSVFKATRGTYTTHIPVMVKTGRLTGMIIHTDMTTSCRSPLQTSTNSSFIRDLSHKTRIKILFSHRD